jgi:tRNA pseudouridine38-40 synthase
VRTLKLTIAYDGTGYVGWQRQPNGISIQQVVEEALQPLARDPISIAGAGRTDAGVHALAQVGSVRIDSDLPAAAIQRAMNVRLPADVRIVAACDAPERFHARFDASGKRYRYRIVNAPVMLPFDRWAAWHAPGVLDVPAMRRAADRLTGRHDFACFQGQAGSAEGEDTVRTVRQLDVALLQGEIAIEIEGDGFLRHMVRCIVGTLVEVGRGQRDPDSLPAVLETGDRRAAGRTAPPQGLTLVEVSYPPSLRLAGD